MATKKLKLTRLEEIILDDSLHIPQGEYINLIARHATFLQQVYLFGDYSAYIDVMFYDENGKRVNDGAHPDGSTVYYVYNNVNHKLYRTDDFDELQDIVSALRKYARIRVETKRIYMEYQKEQEAKEANSEAESVYK